MALMAETTNGPDSLSAREEDHWLRHLADVFKAEDPDTHAITSLLCHLSVAVCKGTSLPPYLVPPQPFPRTARPEVEP